jgi:Conserved TM helix
MWNKVGQSLEESMDRVVYRIATLLPAILAFFAALLLSILIGWLIAFLLRRLLTAVKFDQRASSGTSPISEWSPNYSPTGLVTRTVFWACIVAGILVGLTAFDASSDSAVAPYIFSYLPKVVGAIVLLFCGSIIARFLSRTVLIGAVNMKLQYASLLATGVKWLVLVLTSAMVLDHLAIGGEIVDLAFGILFGGIVFALALAVGLGSRDLVSRSLEREANKPGDLPAAEKLHHF